MSEIVCPSCEAKYRVPDSAIGPEGRRVHCSKCGEIWLAHPVARAAPAAPAHSEAQRTIAAAPTEPGETVAADAGPAASEAAPVEPAWRRAFSAERAASESAAGRVAPIAAPPAPDTAEADTEAAAGAPATGERETQMAEIRRMLDELQTPRHGGDSPAPASPGISGFTPAGTPPPAAAPKRPAPPPVSDDPYVDPLREKLLQHDSRSKTGKPTEGHGNYDPTRLVKRHVRRNRRRMVAEEQRNSSGAFLTGITLTTMVAGAMMLIYAFHAEIAARVPGSGPAMDQYVAVIDGWRGVASEHYAALREKIDQIITDAM